MPKTAGVRKYDEDVSAAPAEERVYEMIDSALLFSEGLFFGVKI